ncbi:MAG: hypothetical protein H7210_11960 [Pyrinomonadaceae bacterium]|nr:hypothetical protein [Phycisphaerales bacterium]
MMYVFASITHAANGKGQHMDEKCSLAEAIANLRVELIQAQQAIPAHSPLKLQIDQAEIELKVGMSREGQVGGKVGFWVYSVQAGGKLAGETIHTVRLKLKALGDNGQPLNVSADVAKPSI